MSFLLWRTICGHLHCSRPEKSSMYSSEYASGFSGSAASHLAAPPSPRHERQCQTGSLGERTT
jgi:hypothetical protein